MRKFSLVISILLILCLAGCHSGTGQANLTEEDNGTTINLKAGDEIVLNLKGNITTGYSWSVQELDEQYLQQQGEEEYKSDSNLIGAGGTSTFTFKAMQAGQTTLRLIYSRPFEKDTPPEKIFEIKVVIR
jgi:inhibitor of cysteine peptidase